MCVCAWFDENEEWFNYLKKNKIKGVRHIMWDGEKEREREVRSTLMTIEFFWIMSTISINYHFSTSIWCTCVGFSSSQVNQNDFPGKYIYIYITMCIYMYIRNYACLLLENKIQNLKIVEHMLECAWKKSVPYSLRCCPSD